MLRIVVIAIGLGLVVLSSRQIFVTHVPWQAGIVPGIFGLLILIGTFFEVQYRSKRAGGAAWQSTGERFVDPSTGALTEVTYNPQTGERSYQTTESKQFPPI
jgi:hypothetical protein